MRVEVGTSEQLLLLLQELLLHQSDVTPMLLHEASDGSLEGLLLLVMELTLLQGRGEGVRGREGVGGERDGRGRG